jgi:peroxiredoxin
LPFKPNRPSLSRRSIIAAAAGLAAAVASRNDAAAQITVHDLPEGAQALEQSAPTPAPDLKFSSATGKALSLADYRGAGLVVNIWATWCPPCVAEFASLAAIAPALAQSRILVLPISVDMEGAAAVRPFYARHHITGLPILLDPDATAPDLLNAAGIPMTVVINPAGKIVASFNGGANWNTPDTIALIRQLAGQRADTGFQPV